MEETRKIKINPFIDMSDKDSYSRNPFVKLDGSNSEEDGAIVVTKKDKQYVVGNKLYVKFKDVGIYAGLDDAISIDTENSNIYIFRNDELSPPEEREYLLLIVYTSDELVDTFMGLSGRQEVFDFIVQNAEVIDMVESKILAETTQMKDMWTFYKFTKMCIDNEMVKNPTGFDPDYFDTTIRDTEE